MSFTVEIATEYDWLAAKGSSAWMLGYVRTELYTAISRSMNSEKTVRKTHLGSNSDDSINFQNSKMLSYF